jgi:hypothetical protein
MKNFHLHEYRVSMNPDQSFQGNGGEICASLHYPFNPATNVTTFSE